MRSIIKSGFFWEFVGGFALGAVALVSFHAPGASVASATSAPIAAQR